ncbi:putative serine incorporator/TMS membrane protein [Helianthus annuus]|nr:putative serine incorporator/TMS membrane protein [Helianthus annuus]
MVIATFSTGIDSKCFQFRKDEKHEEDDVPYGFGFFHFVFATGVMYFAMLLIGWSSNHTMKKWTIDVGWTSTWVRIVNEWLAVCVYRKWFSPFEPLFFKPEQQFRFAYYGPLIFFFFFATKPFI